MQFNMKNMLMSYKVVNWARREPWDVTEVAVSTSYLGKYREELGIIQIYNPGSRNPAIRGEDTGSLGLVSGVEDAVRLILQELGKL